MSNRSSLLPAGYKKMVIVQTVLTYCVFNNTRQKVKLYMSYKKFMLRFKRKIIFVFSSHLTSSLTDRKDCANYLQMSVAFLLPPLYPLTYPVSIFAKRYLQYIPSLTSVVFLQTVAIPKCTQLDVTILFCPLC